MQADPTVNRHQVSQCSVSKIVKMYLSLEMDAKMVREVVFSYNFHVEEVFSEIIARVWSIIFRLIDEEWVDVTLPNENKLPECVLYIGFCEEEDL